MITTATRSLHNSLGLRQGNHVCHLYESEEEHRAALTRFLHDGLDRNEKVLHIVDDRTAQTVLGDLRDDGLDLESHDVRRQTTVLTADEACVRGGVFDVYAMIALLRAETEQALAEGWSALRVISEMTWPTRVLTGSERLIEYEAELNEFLSGSNSLVICLYDQRAVPADLLFEVLTTHPVVAIDTVTYDNCCYVSPAEIANIGRPAAQLRCSLQHLAYRRQAQEALQTLQALHRAMLAATPAMIFRLDKNGSFVGLIPGDGVNPYVLSKEFLEKTMAEMLPTEVAQKTKRHIELALESGEPQLFEYQRLEGGEVRYHEARFVASGADEVLAIVRDLTEQKRQEKETGQRRVREELEGRAERQMLRRNPYGLTFRELTVLHLVADGVADKEIADLLSISIFTANKHVSNILAKMGAGSRTEAGVRAVREGLLT